MRIKAAWLAVAMMNALPCSGEDLRIADAASPKTFGPEFTVTSRALIEGTDPRSAWQRLRRVVTENCAGGADPCAVSVVFPWGEDVAADVVVRYPDGWWFRISVDPHVVEITARPATLAELARLRDRMQRDIFDAAASVGLYPSPSKGGGHINIGVESTFGRDAVLFRNFVVDCANHPELFQGILRWKSKEAAPALSALSVKMRDNFAGAIRDFDEGRLRSIEELADVLNDEVEGFEGNPRYQAVSLVYVGLRSRDERRIEVRGVRAQASADEFISEARLIDRRIEYLRALKGLIPLRIPTEAMSGEEKLDRFTRYVAATGLPIESYKTLPLLGCPLGDLPVATEPEYLVRTQSELLKGKERVKTALSSLGRWLRPAEAAPAEP